MAAPIKFGVGQSVRRKEDDALIRGKGRYTDDHAPSPAMHALMLRTRNSASTSPRPAACRVSARS
jgi:carbon-monoxide dehydrogenase large subunit